MRSGEGGGIYLAVSSTVASLSGLRVSAVDIKKQVKEGEKAKGWGRDGGRVLRQSAEAEALAALEGFEREAVAVRLALQRTVSATGSPLPVSFHQNNVL